MCLENQEWKREHQQAREKEAQRTMSGNSLISRNSLIHTPHYSDKPPKEPHSLFCSQEPKLRKKTSDWKSLGLVTPQKGRDKCFNRHPGLHTMGNALNASQNWGNLGEE